MKYIKRKSAVKPITGQIVDTINVEDKVKNAPSINLVQNMTGIPTEGIVAFDGTEDEIPEGYEKVDSPFEEGTWHPKLICRDEAAPTYSETLVSGEYYKMGKMVFISFIIRGKITALNGTNNYASIGNLPFISKDQMSFGVSLGGIYALTANTGAYALDVWGDEIRIKDEAQSHQKFKITDRSYFDIRGSAWYICKDY